MVKITAEEFQKMLRVDGECLLAHLILESTTSEVIESYKQEKALEIVLTINGIEVDIMPFLKLFEDQYDEQVAKSAKKKYGRQMDKALESFFEAGELFDRLYDHMEDEIKKIVSRIIKDEDIKWLFNEDDEEV